MADGNGLTKRTRNSWRVKRNVQPRLVWADVGNTDGSTNMKENSSLPIIVALALAVFLFSPHAVQAEYVTPALGGSGGTTDYNLDCGPNAVMVGLNGRYGLWIDSISVVCRGINSDGTLGGMYTRGPTGGPGGFDIGESECFEPDQQAPQVVADSIRVRWGTYVGDFSLRCITWNRRPGESSVSYERDFRVRPSSSTTLASPISTNLQCNRPGASIVRGLRGRSGEFVDSVALICDNSPAPAAVSSPSTPPAVILKSPVVAPLPTKQLPNQLADATAFCNLPVITLSVSPSTVVTGQQPRISVTFNCQRREDSVVRISSRVGLFFIPGENLIRIPAGKMTGERYVTNHVLSTPVTDTLTAVLEGVQGAVPSQPAFLRILPR
jgi:hypothetical protein